MPELSKKLDRFTSALLSEASAEAERVSKELKERHDAALSSAEDQVLLEAYDYIHREVSRIRSEQGRLVSRHMLERKQALFRRREEIASEVFALVRARTAAFTRTEAYPRRLSQLLREALIPLSGAEDTVVYLREEDLPLAGALIAQAGRPLTIQAGPVRMGGLIAQSHSLGLRIDSSFDANMEELRGHFASLVGLSLVDAADDGTLEGGTRDHE